MVNRSIYKTVLWSVYLAIIVCSILWELLPLPQNPKEYIGIVSSLIWCIGLFGFVFQRRILHKLFWRIWFSLIMLTTASAFTLFIFTMSTRISQTPSYALLLFYSAIIVLILPMYYALYAYVYRSPNIWQGSA
jgi:NADH:ubiquinone oxidoreductase subunit K